MTGINHYAKRSINDEIRHASRGILDNIPISNISDILERWGLMLVQEDGTKWSGFLCGVDGAATIDIATEHGEIIKNSMLYIQWHKYDTGRYDIVCYLS